MGAFSDKFEAFEKKVFDEGGLADQVFRKIVLDVQTSLVLKSPVGDPSLWAPTTPVPPGYVGGRFRGNWMIGFGGINKTTSENIDKTGELSIGRVEERLNDIRFGGTYFLTNALPYGPALEDGWSYKQAPNGMVRITVIEFRDTVNGAIREVKAL